ncbi:MAG: hypothetical protein ABSH24_04280 [Bryobacteraceae bacterium]|jgi:hypothetical protein
MSFRGIRLVVAASLIGPAAILAQAPSGASSAPSQPRTRAAIFESLAQPPVPADPLELVLGDAQSVQNAEQRAAAVHLLTSARALSNVRAYPYDLKTTFVASGSSAGSWTLEDSSPAREVYRWAAQGPSYSAVNLHTNQLVYSNQPAGAMPLRLAQVRTAIFFVYPATGPYANLRTAIASLNGVEVSCILVSHGSPSKSAAGGRRWEESEYCIDPKSGLLMSYSPAPGMYVAYDYANAIHFHDKVIPGKFTITQAGQTVVEARTESVTDAGKLDPAIFQPAGLEKVGAGPLMSPPWRVRTRGASGSGNPSGALQVVVLDGMVTAEGKLGELEVLASSNAALNQTAQEEAAAWKNWQSQEDAQPGATPQSHEVFFTVEFAQSEP